MRSTKCLVRRRAYIKIQKKPLPKQIKVGSLHNQLCCVEGSLWDGDTSMPNQGGLK